MTFCGVRRGSTDPELDQHWPDRECEPGYCNGFGVHAQSKLRAAMIVALGNACCRPTEMKESARPFPCGELFATAADILRSSAIGGLGPAAGHVNCLLVHSSSYCTYEEVRLMRCLCCQSAFGADQWGRLVMLSN